jgi:hypothetical protein
MYSDHKLEHQLLYNSTNTSDIFDFLQKQFLIYWTEILLVNLDTRSDDQQKFDKWKRLVTNFLNKLMHKHTEAQLNALYLYIDPAKIKKILRGLYNLELGKIHKSADMTETEKDGGFRSIWFEEAHVTLGVGDETVSDPIYFGRVVKDQNKHRDGVMLRLQGKSIKASLALGEIAVKSYHMNDRGCIKRCICDTIKDRPALNATNHGYVVDLWLSIILTTMHIQLSYFRCIQQKVRWHRPLDLNVFFHFLNDRYFKKWNDSGECKKQAEYDTQMSDFGETQIRIILDRARKYDEWMQQTETETSVDEVDASNGGPEQEGEREVAGQIYNLSKNENSAIFKSELEDILSRVMYKRVYPICKNDKREHHLIESTFNAAINNESVAEFMSEDYLFRQKKKPTKNEVLVHGHMQHVIGICDAWYKIPDITYTPQSALAEAKEQTHISEFKVLYMSEERNRAFHRNRVG